MITTEQSVQIKRDLLDAAKLVSRRAMTVGRHAGIDGSSHSVERRIGGWRMSSILKQAREAVEKASEGLITAAAEIQTLAGLVIQAGEPAKPDEGALIFVREHYVAEEQRWEQCVRRMPGMPDVVIGYKPNTEPEKCQISGLSIVRWRQYVPGPA